METKYSDTMTKSEAMTKAGLNWTVSARPIYDHNGSEITSHKALVRDDTEKRFGIVSSRYVPFQNDALFNVTERFLETGAAKYVRAQMYKHGQKVSARVAIPDADFEVLPNDRCRAFLDISTSHDGTSSIKIVPLVYRLICLNGLHVWKEDTIRTVSARHVKGASDKLVIDAGRILVREIDFFREFSEKMRALAAKEFGRLELDDFLNELLTAPGEDFAETPHFLRVKEELVHLTHKGTGQDIPGVQNTAYAAFNAVTEYVTHKKGGEELAREYSELYGSGRDLRERAYALLTR